MQYQDSRMSVGRAAVALVAAFVICASVAVSSGKAYALDKTRSKAERALRNGDYDVAEKLFRELVE